MATLTGSTIASTYKQLLKVTSEGIGADASAKYIEDGLGTDSALSISTTRVGIGTDSPTYDVDVLKSVSGGTVALRVANSNTGANSAAMLYLGAFGASGTGDPYIYFNDDSNDWAIGSDKSDSSKFKISDSSSVGTNDRLVIDTSGNIGVGVTNPGSAAGSNALDIRDTNTSSATQGASLRLGSNDGAVMGAGHRMGVIEFAGAEDGGGTMVGGARIDALAVDAFTATGTYDHNSKLQFSVQSGTSGTDQLASPAMVLDANSRISLSNNDSGGTTNTIFGHTAGNAIVSGAASNVLIGHESGLLLGHADSDANTAVGFNTMKSSGTASNNTAYHNTAIGSDALAQITTGNDNVCLGSSAGYALTTANKVVFIGRQAGDTVTTTGANGTVGIGYQALTALTSGAGNTAVGYQALDATDDGNYNTAVGTNALSANCGDGNTAIGNEAAVVTTGQANTAIGGYFDSTYKAPLQLNVTGSYSIAIGSGALMSTTADDVDGSVAIGFGALKALNATSGSQHASATIGIGMSAGGALNAGVGNVAIGHSALAAEDTGDGNTAVGFKALTVFNGADNNGNTAIGYLSLTACTTSVNNTAVGYQAGAALIGGGLNTILGYQALDAATTVNNTIAIGHSAMGAVPADQAVEYAIAIGQNAMLGSGSTTTGINGNIAIGADAGKVLTTGGGNTLIGYAAGDELTTGQNNTIIGRHTLGNGDGDEDDNTLIGYAAGDVIDNGNQITCLGSGTDPSTAAGANQTVIGYGTTGVADDSVTLGNDDVTRVNMSSDGAAVMYADGTINTSDRRFKENIEDTDLGLSFINLLRPVKYNFIENKHDGKTKYGIIAQEVIEVLNETGNLDFAGIKDDNEEKLGADYVQFIAPLIKAVQELSAKVEALESK